MRKDYSTTKTLGVVGLGPVFDAALAAGYAEADTASVYEVLRK
jgi:hypothetical protein